jgi:hypothetical protein
VAKQDFTPGKSNVNVLFIFDAVDLATLDRLSLIFQQAIAEFRLAPFILTTSEIIPSSDVFAVKLFDIQKHHLLLYGEDHIRSLQFVNQHLKFIAEQELRNQLARMKFFYIQNFNVSENLLAKVQKGFTSLLINANTFIFLKRGLYFKTRKEIIGQLLKEPEMDEAMLEGLLKLKDGTVELSPQIILKAYDDLMIQYKQLTKALKQITIHG